MLPGANKGTQSGENKQEAQQFEAAGSLFIPRRRQLYLFFFFFPHRLTSVLRHCCEDVAAGLQGDTKRQGLQVGCEAEDA